MKKLNNLSNWLRNYGYSSESDEVDSLLSKASKEISYTIQSGDILGSIAAKYDVSVSEIVAANRGLDPTRLQLGQEILIPPSKHSFLYIINSGDTLSGIADQYNITVDDIMDKNKRANQGSGLNATNLVPGTQIRVPYAASLEQKRKEADKKHIRKWSGSDDDLLAMTLLGEGGTFEDSGDETMREVYTVIENRMKNTGGSLKDIVFAPGQFEFWIKYKPEDIYSGSDWGVLHPRWRNAMMVVKSKPRHPDVSFSTHYWNPRIVSPSWRNEVLVLHESKHVYGVLVDESVVFKKVFRENKSSIKDMIEKRKFYNYNQNKGKIESGLLSEPWLNNLLA